MQFFLEIVKLISDGLKKGRVLVHCQAGMSRSSSAIICFIIDTFNLDYFTALKTVKINHPIAQPNEGFARQLKQWEAEVRSRWAPTTINEELRVRLDDWASGNRSTSQVST